MVQAAGMYLTFFMGCSCLPCIFKPSFRGNGTHLHATRLDGQGTEAGLLAPVVPPPLQDVRGAKLYSQEEMDCSRDSGPPAETGCLFAQHTRKQEIFQPFQKNIV